jgi:hypothetical protein
MKTRIVCSITSSSDNPAFYEISWKKRCGIGQVTGDNNLIIGRIRIACWITKVKNTHSGYIIPNALLLQQWVHERASMLRYTYISCLCV